MWARHASRNLIPHNYKLTYHNILLFQYDSPAPSDLNMDADAGYSLDLSRVPSNFIALMLQSMSLSDRFTSALVCKAWAQEAAAANRSITLRFNHSVKDYSCFQRWLEKHGDQVEVLQLHECRRHAVLTALPCPQLQDLLLKGISPLNISLDSRMWSDLAAATKLTSVSLDYVQTASQQAAVVSALTALPHLEQLTWGSVTCGQQYGLTDSMLLQKLTKLTALKLSSVRAAAALEHLGLLTRLQDLSLCVPDDWAAMDCPRLQELKALTKLVLYACEQIPPSVSQLTALQQLEVPRATPTALNKLWQLNGLTQLLVRYLADLVPNPPPLQLPGLQRLEIGSVKDGTMPVSFLGSCTQLQLLKLSYSNLSGPGSLVASSMLQHLELYQCRVSAADGAAGPVSWQQVFSGPGRLPYLTSLLMQDLEPDLQHPDIEYVVSCCRNLQVLELDAMPNNSASALMCLSGLTSLGLDRVDDQQCSSLAQLTGLRKLRVEDASKVFAAGLRQLAALEQLTSLEIDPLGCTSDVLQAYMSDIPPGPFTPYHTLVNQVCVCVWGGGDIT